MTAVTPSTLLLTSAFLHAAWNTTTKVSKDKDIFVFLTIFFSCVLVLIALLIQEDSFSIGGSSGLRFSVLAGIFEGGYLIAMAKGFARASLAKAYSIMRGGAMVLVWAISLLLAMEHFSGVALIGSLIVLVGIVVTGAGQHRSGIVPNGEMLWPLIGAGFIAGYHICYGESLKYGAEPKALFLTALLISLPFIFLSTRRNFVSRSMKVFSEEKMKLLISSIGASLGFVIFLYGLKHSGPGYAITLRNTSIFFAIGFAFLIRDRMTKYQIAGATIVGIGAMVLSFGNLAWAQVNCEISGEEVARYLKMDYQSFDQDLLGGGWRKYGEHGCYLTAANLLDQYYAAHNEMLPSQKRVIAFHSGQMYGFANDYLKAIPQFNMSFNPDEPNDTPLLWNAYVDATIAFLKKDRDTLLKDREKIANGPVFQGKRANLNVVDGFIKCFERPYSEAYGQCR